MLNTETIPGFCLPRSIELMYARSIAHLCASSSCDIPCASRKRRIASPRATREGASACRGEDEGIARSFNRDDDLTTDDLPHILNFLNSERPGSRQRLRADCPQAHASAPACCASSPMKKAALLLPIAVTLLAHTPHAGAADSRCLGLVPCTPQNSAATELQADYRLAQQPSPTTLDRSGVRPQGIWVAQGGNPLSDAARSQRNILDSIAQDNRRRATVEETQRRLSARDSVITQEVFRAAVEAGIKMVPVKQELDRINVGRRMSGVWDLNIVREIDGPYLVLVGSFTDLEPQFAVQGAGLYGVRGSLRDREFERTGVFDPACRYQVSLGNASREYPCEDYLSGSIHSQVVSDMKAMLADSLTSQRRANATRQ